MQSTKDVFFSFRLLGKNKSKKQNMENMYMYTTIIVCVITIMFDFFIIRNFLNILNVINI